MAKLLVEELDGTLYCSKCKTVQNADDERADVLTEDEFLEICINCKEKFVEES